MELFFIWLLCGIASAVIASNKGRSGFGWFLLGLLLGPFGILFAAISSNLKLERAHESAVKKAAHEEAASKKCPYCAEHIKGDAIVCRYCGKDQPPQPAPLSEDERFQIWLKGQEPPIANPTTEQLLQLRAAFDYRRKVREI